MKLKNNLENSNKAIITLTYTLTALQRPFNQSCLKIIIKVTLKLKDFYLHYTRLYKFILNSTQKLQKMHDNKVNEN